METFTDARPLVSNPRFSRQRQAHLSRLDIETIDPPIRDIILGFAKVLCCFTLQSCYGHLLPETQGDPRSIEPLPLSRSTATIRHRIAYLALCIENSGQGRTLLHDLRDIPSIDPQYVQFGSAEWFWKRLVNAYALQVEPRRYMNRDEARVGYQEARHIQEVRDRFFAALRLVLHRHLASTSDGVA